MTLAEPHSSVTEVGRAACASSVHAGGAAGFNRGPARPLAMLPTQFSIASLPTLCCAAQRR